MEIEDYVSVTGMATKKATIVNVHAHALGQAFNAWGESKKMSGDVTDYELGYTLAFQRALEDLLVQVKKASAKVIKENDSKMSPVLVYRKP
jgi:hypothetical protein